MNNSTHPRSSVRPVNRGVSRPGAPMHYRGVMDASLNEPVLLREVLRAVRQHQGRTLREVSAEARVSLGYLSEVERGQKEASSELLGSICQALQVPLYVVLREVSDRIARAERSMVPDTVPDELVRSQSALSH